MELRQLRYFVRVVELGSMGRAARDLGMVASALSQQISRLESELSTRLLQRTAAGVVPTDAGLAFWRQAQLALRHADGAVIAAREARMSGSVSVGFAPATAYLLSQPYYDAMRARYPDVRLHLVEGLSGNLASLLHGRQLDLAVLFHVDPRWSALHLLDEKLFLFAPAGMVDGPPGREVSLAEVGHLPLVSTSRLHGMRNWVEAAFERVGLRPNVAVEVDGLSSLMDIVQFSRLATIQPGATASRLRVDDVHTYPLADPLLIRRNVITSVSDDELSPPALAARVVLTDLMRTLVREGRWPGATLHES